MAKQFRVAELIIKKIYLKNRLDDSMKEEIWKDIKGYKGLYQVSSFGRVKSFKTNLNGKILKQRTNPNGYKSVNLSLNGKVKLKVIHRLVMETFKEEKLNFKYMPNEDISIINLDKLIINHIDGNKENNNITNLEWCTYSYNINEALRLGLRKRDNYRRGKIGKNCPNSLSVNQYDINGKFIRKWDSIMDVKRFYNKSVSHISDCCKNKRRTCLGYIWRYNNE